MQCDRGGDFPNIKRQNLGFRLAFKPIQNSAYFDLNSTAPLTIAENQPIGTMVGEFNATDPDGDILTYFLVSGKGVLTMPNLQSMQMAF